MSNTLEGTYPDPKADSVIQSKAGRLLIGPYRVQEKIRETAQHVVYKAQDESGRKVVIKSTKPGVPDIFLRREYELSRLIKFNYAVNALGFYSRKEHAHLVMEDVDGKALDLLFPGPVDDLNLFLDIAIDATQALNEVHEGNVIHMDISPANILRNPKTNELRLIDFGIASSGEAHRVNFFHVALIPGTLECMSPEQSGRLNRPVDSRSDYYSLGATFFRLLTGRYPFAGKTPKEILYGHLYKPVPTPTFSSAKIPISLSSLVVKLMNKDPQDRYQSGETLLHDLLHIRESLTSGKDSHQPFFIPQHKESPKHLHIPFIRRRNSKNTQELLDAWKLSAKGAKKIVLIAGETGSGKNSLVGELLEPLTKKNALFLSPSIGEDYLLNPLSLLRQAFEDLSERFIGNDPKNLMHWRGLMSSALKGNDSIVLDVLPALEKILEGPRRPIPGLGSQVDKNRFIAAVVSLFATFCRAEHPLLFHIKNLSLVDRESLEVLNKMIHSPEVGHMLFVCALTYGEMNESHPNKFFLDQLLKYPGVAIIKTENMTFSEVQTLTSKALDLNEKETKALSTVLYEKTAGNPLFFKELLLSLHKENAITFDRQKGSWAFDLDAISDFQISSNVADLLLQKIPNFPEATLKIVWTAACIGQRFEISLLSELLSLPLENLYETLEPFVREGFFVISYGKVSESYIGETKLAEKNVPENVSLAFSHKRIQKFIYNQKSEIDRTSQHLRIGRLLLKEYRKHGQISVQRVVFHLSKAVTLLYSKEDKAEFTQLNLVAAQAAMSRHAFEYALDTLKLCLSCVNKEHWESHQELMFDLHLELYRCLYLTDHTDWADKIYPLLLENRKSEEQHIAALRDYCMRHSKTYNYNNVVAVCENIFRKIWSEEPTRANVLAALEEEERLFEIFYKDKGLEEHIGELPFHEDSFALNFQILVSTSGAMAFLYCRNELYALLSLWLANSVAKKETRYLTRGLCNVLINMAFVRSGQKRYDEANKLACSSIALAGRIGVPTHPFSFLYRVGVLVWREPYSELFSQSEKKDFFEVADNVYMTKEYAPAMYLEIMWCMGSTLMEMEAFLDKLMVMPIIKDSALALSRNLPFKQYLSLLRDPWTETETPNAPTSEMERVFTKVPKGIFTYAALFAHLHLVLGEPQKALDVAEMYDSEILRRESFTLRSELVFIQCLALAWVYDELEEGDVRKINAKHKINDGIEEYEIWSKSCPKNFAAKHLILKAESARLNGDLYLATGYYVHGLALAEKTGLHHIAALGHESFARFWINFGEQDEHKDKAVFHLNRACLIYRKWGVLRRTGASELRMEIDGSVVLSGIYNEHQHKEPSTAVAQNDAVVFYAMREENAFPVEVLDTLKDLLTLFSTTSLQGKMSAKDTGRCLHRVLQFIMNDSLAGGVALLSVRKGEPALEASLNVEGLPENIGEPIELKEIPENILPKGAIYYSLRTGKLMSSRERFSLWPHDPFGWIESKSAVCIPLGERLMNGVLYLENCDIMDTLIETVNNEVSLSHVMATLAVTSLQNVELFKNTLNKHQESTEEMSLERKRLHLFMKEFSKELIEQLEEGFLEAQSLRTKIEGLRKTDPVDSALLTERMALLEELEVLGKILKDVSEAASKLDVYSLASDRQKKESFTNFNLAKSIREAVSSLNKEMHEKNVRLNVTGLSELNISNRPDLIKQILKYILDIFLFYGSKTLKSNITNININVGIEGQEATIDFTDNASIADKKINNDYFEVFAPSQIRRGLSSLDRYILISLVTGLMQGKIFMQNLNSSGFVRVTLPLLNT